MDDVVGCVELGLDNLLRQGTVDKWEPIARQPDSLGLLGRLWRSMAGPPQQAALKLTATMEGSNLGGSCFKDPGLPGDVKGNNAMAVLLLNPQGGSGGGGQGDGGGGGLRDRETWSRLDSNFQVEDKFAMPLLLPETKLCLPFLPDLDLETRSP
jgi:hypothetical protein